MTYNASIPQAADLIFQSQGQLLINFGQLNTLYNLDHVAFDDVTAANRGLHRKITFQTPLVANPNPTAPVSDLYTRTAGSGVSDLYFQDNVAAGASRRVTGGGITTAAWVQFNGTTATLNEQYNVTSVVRNGAGDYTINFTRNFATTNYSVQIYSGIFPQVVLFIQARAVGSLRMTTLGNVDSTDVNVVIFGTLA